MKRFTTLRAELANLSPADLLKRAPAACRAAVVAAGATVIALRAGGTAVSADQRNAMLMACKAGEYVELELDVLAYEQKTGVANRNFVRFRDGAMMALGRTGVGRPFLRDHEQRDVQARAGTILASRTDKRGEGDYAVIQTVKLTATWAVELALRGLLDTVSIGWNPTAPVMCSACDAAIFTKCWHCPGDRLTEVDDESGGKRRTRKADGEITVEWIFTEAELVETSVVSVPGVPGAHIDGIRAALAAGPDHESGDQPREEEISMKKLAGLAALLGLAATAGEDEVITAAENKIEALTAKLEVADADVVRLTAANDVFETAKKKTAADAFINGAITSGRITLGDEEVWRKLYKVDQADAIATMAKRKAGSSTPVGQDAQAKVEQVDPGNPATAASDGVKAAYAAAGVDMGAAHKVAKAFGAKDPNRTAARALGLGGEG